MATSFRQRQRAFTRGSALFCTVAVLGVAAAGPAAAVQPKTARPSADNGGSTFGGAQPSLADKDLRGAAKAPLAAAVADVKSFGTVGKDIDADYTQYGTVKSLVNYTGPLATGLSGSAATVARTWVAQHASLFGISSADANALELYRDNILSSTTDSHAVLFRQHVGGYAMAEDGLIDVAVKDGDVYGVTSSAVPTTSLNATTATQTAATAVLAAAQDAGITSLTLPDLKIGKVDANGFTHVLGKGLAQQQYVKLVALPMTSGPAHLAFAVNLSDVAGSTAIATVSYVDALSGAVLLRHNAVDTDAEGAQADPSMRAITTAQATTKTLAGLDVAGSGTFTGSYTPTTCSTPQVLPLPTGTTAVALTATSIGLNAADSIDIDLTFSNPARAPQTFDTADSPQVGEYIFSPAFQSASPAETASVSVCAFDPSQTGGNFAGTFTTTQAPLPTVPSTPGVPNVPGAADVGAPMTLQYFPYSPELGYSSTNPTTRRVTGCGPAPTLLPSTKTTNCDVQLQTKNLPNAYDTVNGVPTGQTAGNNAVETNAQYSDSLTPGGAAVTYASPTREFDPVYSDSWRSSGCNPTTIVTPTPTLATTADATPGFADVHASQANLFSGHNRLHDFAYLLGLNDKTGSLQATNASGAGAQGDPEIGSVQNAAASDLALRQLGPVYTEAGIGLTGRNNANQITEMDGVPGLTNQYLFEPVVGFYGPCTDGDDDASVFLHEYTHAISNRLIAGPDTSLSGQQGGSMGESWSDLDAIEFLNAFGFAQSSGADRYAEGPFVTGNNTIGIRDYNLLNNPLTYGELGFDSTGPEVHADGEIWNGTEMQVRQALIDYWKTQGLGDDNRALEVQCATATNADGSPRMIGGVLDSFTGCPGDRRWITYIYDSLILQGNGAPTFLDMRDTTIMSVLMRNPAGSASADYKAVEDSFAKRGEGLDASSTGTADTDPIPGFASPVGVDNATVTFKTVDADTGAAITGAKVFVGTYEARATPLATSGAGGRTATKTMVGNAGTSAAGDPASYTFVVQAPGYGLTRVPATTFTPGTTTTKVIPLSRNFASVASGSAPVLASGQTRVNDAFDDTEATDSGIAGQAPNGDTYTVKLDGTHQLQAFGVGALNRPVNASDSTDFQARITNLRSFHLQTSTDGGATWTTVYTSPSDFFPASVPRPVAPEENYRTVSLAAPVTANALRLVVDATQCTGEPTFSGPNLTPNDSLNDSSCVDNATYNQQVNVDEIEAFGPSAAMPSAPVSLAESPTAVALPIVALAALATAVAFRRRRRTTRLV